MMMAQITLTETMLLAGMAILSKQVAQAIMPLLPVAPGAH
jgi:hypothetical protein